MGVDDHFLFVSGDKNLISAGMEIGLRVEVSSITNPKVSLSGSMKKINSESSQWKKVEMSKVFLNACLEALRLSDHQSKMNPARSSCLTKNMVTCILAPPILAPV